MKALWVSLVEFPPLSKSLGKMPAAHCGWLYSSAIAAKKVMPDLELGVLVYSYDKTFEKHRVEGITYYLIPSADMAKVSKSQKDFCHKAISDFAPDIIHLHGTEYSLAAAVCEANEHSTPMVANIQGLAIPYTRYADGGLSMKDKLINITPLDFYRGTFLFNAKHSFRKRAKCEEFVLKNVEHVVGRTKWDKDHALSVNPKLTYHFMNETLRDSFYQEPRWSLNNCQRHAIFVSNSGSALKGAHQVLNALPVIMQKYPDTEVYFCGSSVMNNDVKSLMRMQGYHLYLRRLVKKMGLIGNVKFLGQLSEVEMKQAFLNANVYVMPSAIENSPNSLCEAQILGVPTVAAYVGGVPDLVSDGSTGFLYRYEETEQLAQIIMRLFEKSDFTELTKAEMTVASQRHDREKNADTLKEIYSKILGKNA